MTEISFFCCGKRFSITHAVPRSVSSAPLHRPSSPLMLSRAKPGADQLEDVHFAIRQIFNASRPLREAVLWLCFDFWKALIANSRLT